MGSTDVAKDVLCFTKIATLRQWWVILCARPNQIKSLRTLWAIYNMHTYFMDGYLRIYFPRSVMSFAIYTYWTYFHVSADVTDFSLVHTLCVLYTRSPCCVSRPRTWSSLWKLPCQFKRAAARLLWAGRCMELSTNEGWTKRVYFIRVIEPILLRE